MQHSKSTQILSWNNTVYGLWRSVKQVSAASITGREFCETRGHVMLLHSSVCLSDTLFLLCVTPRKASTSMCSWKLWYTVTPGDTTPQFLGLSRGLQWKMCTMPFVATNNLQSRWALLQGGIHQPSLSAWAPSVHSPDSPTMHPFNTRQLLFCFHCKNLLGTHGLTVNRRKKKKNHKKTTSVHSFLPLFCRKWAKYLCHDSLKFAALLWIKTEFC